MDANKLINSDSQFGDLKFAEVHIINYNKTIFLKD